VKEEKKVRFEVLMVVRMTTLLFWVVMPRIYLRVYTASQAKTTTLSLKEGILKTKCCLVYLYVRGINCSTELYILKLVVR
jgi:hypothetical protein